MDYEQIEAMVAVLRESRLVELEVSMGENFHLRLQRPASTIRSTVSQPASRVSVAQKPISVDTLPTLVTAPLVGIFRMVRGATSLTGATVKAGQVIGQIEAMRLLSDCVVPIEGRIHAVRVQDGQPVEYGQPLFEIMPNTNP